MKTGNRTYVILAGLGIITILILGVGISFVLLRGVSITRIKAAWKQLTEKKVADIPLNKNTLYISSPVTSIDGKLTSINSNTITVTHHYVLSSSVGDIPEDQKNKDVSFQFTVTPQTKIFLPPTFIPYLFKNQQNTSNQILKQSDLKCGQYVSVTTNGNLQVAQSVPYQATSIQITRIANNVQGSISQISDNTFTMAAPLPPLPASFPPRTSTAQQTYTVHITPDTEISRRQYNFGTPQQLTVSDLVKGTIVTVYTNEDSGVDHDFTALLIVPVDTRPAPSPSPSQSAPTIPTASTHSATGAATQPPSSQ